MALNSTPHMHAQMHTEILRSESRSGLVNSPSFEMHAIYNDDVLHDQDMHVDLEQKAMDDAHLLNDTVHSFLWQEVTVTVKDHAGKQKAILDNIQGIVKAGLYKTSVRLGCD